jgi:hypothetical protein
MSGVTEAIKLQAFEYGRRLDELNHSHAQQQANQATYVSRELFENFVKDLSTWREQTNVTLSARDGRVAGTAASRIMIFQLITLVLGLSALVVAILKGV